MEFYPYHPLASGSFTQDWSNTGLITTAATGNDEWVGIDDISISGTLPRFMKFKDQGTPAP